MAQANKDSAKPDTHAAKVPRLDVANSQNFNNGPAVAIPPKIEEGVEPD